MNITKSALIAGTGAKIQTAELWLPSIQAACDKFQISTSKQRIAAFLANVGVESDGFATLEENLHYTAMRLAQVWPNRYSTDGTAKGAPNATAQRIGGNPQAIANNVYANRMGNGDEASGDGWNYRGQGPLQLTGKDTILACMMAIDVDLVNNPSALQQPEAGSLSAAWFFTKYKDCLTPADAGDFSRVVELINGQKPCAANQGPLRQSRYEELLKVL